jgi:hypothetical protein
MCVPFPKMGQVLSATITGDWLLRSPSTPGPGRGARAVASLVLMSEACRLRHFASAWICLPRRWGWLCKSGVIVDRPWRNFRRVRSCVSWFMDITFMDITLSARPVFRPCSGPQPPTNDTLVRSRILVIVIFRIKSQGHVTLGMPALIRKTREPNGRRPQTGIFCIERH